MGASFSDHAVSFEGKASQLRGRQPPAQRSISCAVVSVRAAKFNGSPGPSHRDLREARPVIRPPIQTGAIPSRPADPPFFTSPALQLGLRTLIQWYQGEQALSVLVGHPTRLSVNMRNIGSKGPHTLTSGPLCTSRIGSGSPSSAYPFISSQIRCLSASAGTAARPSRPAAARRRPGRPRAAIDAS